MRAERLLAHREKEKETNGATVTHYIMQACARALAAYPQANRSYDRGRWIRWKVVHRGLAVQTAAGLVVAVPRQAQQRDLAWIATRTRELVARARSGKLSTPERTNPTLTLSSLGAHDVESFAAIINPPEAVVGESGGTAGGSSGGTPCPPRRLSERSESLSGFVCSPERGLMTANRL